MEFAIQVSGVYEDVLAAARFSEERSLPAIALPDHYLMALDEEKAQTTPAPDALIQLGLGLDLSNVFTATMGAYWTFWPAYFL